MAQGHLPKIGIHDHHGALQFSQTRGALGRNFIAALDLIEHLIGAHTQARENRNRHQHFNQSKARHILARRYLVSSPHSYAPSRLGSRLFLWRH
ncbi:Uncharacterised protein [Vibrio cholerae]|nr:Uncharacterised protein [Vibrio cholerae]